MDHNPDNLVKQIHDTKALSIWNRNKGPVFWYTAGVPGPYFVNTEWVIGKELANSLIDGITGIMSRVSEPAARAQQLTSLIMSAYEKNPMYRQAITAVIAKEKQELPTGSYAYVSGGERRDWLFSIPFAKETGAKHVFLFKDQSHYCEHVVEPESNVLHIADLINNAASYFDRWLPALAKAHLRCHATVCVVSRNNGAAKLEEAGIETVSLVKIDLAFFEKSHANKLIDKETLDEIVCHFRSAETWAEKYLIGNMDVFDVAHVDKKSFERLQSFFTQDPWSLRLKHKAFFDAMHTAIAARLKNAA